MRARSARRGPSSTRRARRSRPLNQAPSTRPPLAQSPHRPRPARHQNNRRRRGFGDRVAPAVRRPANGIPAEFLEGADQRHGDALRRILDVRLAPSRSRATTRSQPVPPGLERSRATSLATPRLTKRRRNPPPGASKRAISAQQACIRAACAVAASAGDKGSNSSTAPAARAPRAARRRRPRAASRARRWRSPSRAGSAAALTVSCTRRSGLAPGGGRARSCAACRRSAPPRRCTPRRPSLSNTVSAPATAPTPPPARPRVPR